METNWGLDLDRHRAEIAARAAQTRTDTATWRSLERQMLAHLESLPVPCEHVTLPFPTSDYLHIERVWNDAVQSGTVRGEARYESEPGDGLLRQRIHDPAITALGRLRLEQLRHSTSDARVSQFAVAACAATAGYLVGWLLLTLVANTLA